MKITPELKSHLTDHIEKWPATKEEIVAACDNMGHFTDEERRWFSESLMDKTYYSPDEVISELEKEKAAAM